jgi:hypothetical protein
MKVQTFVGWYLVDYLHRLGYKILRLLLGLTISEESLAYFTIENIAERKCAHSTVKTWKFRC